MYFKVQLHTSDFTSTQIDVTSFYFKIKYFLNTFFLKKSINYMFCNMTPITKLIPQTLPHSFTCPHFKTLSYVANPPGNGFHKLQTFPSTFPAIPSV